MIVADTNVVSEFMRETPDQAVLTWAESLAAGELGICVVSVEEVERGLGRLPQGRRRGSLERRWHALLTRFRDMIAVYDVAAARATARIVVEAEAAGRPIGLADAQIAGICIANAYGLATRNLRDFKHVAGLNLIDPFG